jgi:predicted nucleic acid-binding protein
MDIKYLWDTNTVIYFLQGQFPGKGEIFIDNTLNISPPTISAITEIELLCWKTPNTKDLETLQKFINVTHVFELETDIKLKTAVICKSHKIKLPDAIIAATAIINNLTLITRNTKDFKNIENLKLINPFEI